MIREVNFPKLRFFECAVFLLVNVHCVVQLITLNEYHPGFTKFAPCPFSLHYRSYASLKIMALSLDESSWLCLVVDEGAS